jgi:hypothetical protein
MLGSSDVPSPNFGGKKQAHATFANIALSSQKDGDMELLTSDLSCSVSSLLSQYLIKQVQPSDCIFC